MSEELGLETGEQQESGQQNLESASTDTSNVSTSESSADVSSETKVDEPKFTQQQLNEIAAQQYRRGQEKIRREMLQEQQRLASQQESQSKEEAQAYTPSQIRAMIAQAKVEEKQQEWADGIGKRVEAKVEAARLSDPDFGDTYEKLNIERIPTLAIHLDKVPNTADVMKELAKHPQKYANVITLMQVSPAAADDAILAISKSIEANKKAPTQKQAKPPLDDIKPSNFDSGKGDGPKSVADYRKLLSQKKRR